MKSWHKLRSIVKYIVYQLAIFIKWHKFNSDMQRKKRFIDSWLNPGAGLVFVWRLCCSSLLALLLYLWFLTQYVLWPQNLMCLKLSLMGRTAFLCFSKFHWLLLALTESHAHPWTRCHHQEIWYGPCLRPVWTYPCCWVWNRALLNHISWLWGGIMPQRTCREGTSTKVWILWRDYLMA